MNHNEICTLARLTADLLLPVDTTVTFLGKVCKILDDSPRLTNKKGKSNENVHM
jgi:hypothetical protein